ncbi:MAG TPA: glycosyltransferase family 61 protein [Chitinophaga sp.]
MQQEAVQLHPGYTAVTKKPLHLQPGDAWLFENAFHTVVAPVTLLRLSNAHVLKQVIFTLKPLRFYTAFTNIFPVPAITLLKRLFRLGYKTQKLPAGSWITDEWSAEYYHWFADALPRLLAVAEVCGKEVPVVLPDYYAGRSYIPASLHRLGFQAYYYNPGQRLLVRKLLLTSRTARVGDTNRDYINKLRDQCKVTAGKPERKIYISRQKARVRKVTNEAAVWALVQRHGYEVHFMEDYTLEQQITLLAGTRTIVGLHGAGLTNMLFMPAGGQVLELRNKGDNRLNCFFSLASNLDHRYYYLTADGNKANSYDVEVTVDLPALEAMIVTMEKEA